MLIERLRTMCADIRRKPIPLEHLIPLMQEAANEIERLHAEAEALKTTMIAAAEEIHAHWAAHCDADGYGPANLMRRLEEGIPAEYGYTAGAFFALSLVHRSAGCAYSHGRFCPTAVCMLTILQRGRTECNKEG